MLPTQLPGFDSWRSQPLSMLLRLIGGAAAESSGQQRLNFIDRIHLVLVSGKLVLQKRIVLLLTKFRFMARLGRC